MCPQSDNTGTRETKSGSIRTAKKAGLLETLVWVAVVAVIVFAPSLRWPEAYAGGLAIALLLGFAALPAVAVILAVRMLIRARRSIGGTVGPTALILISGLLAFGVYAALFGALQTSRASARKAVCLSHVKTLAMALRMYAEDDGGAFPAASEWADRLIPYAEGPAGFRCPEVHDLRCAYAFNSRLSAARAKAVLMPGKTISLFESDGGWNAHGGLQLLTAKARHLDGDNYGRVDGSAVWMHRRELPDGSLSKEPDADWVRWQP